MPGFNMPDGCSCEPEDRGTGDGRSVIVGTKCAKAPDGEHEFYRNLRVYCFWCGHECSSYGPSPVERPLAEIEKRWRALKQKARREGRKGDQRREDCPWKCYRGDPKCLCDPTDNPARRSA